MYQNQAVAAGLYNVIYIHCIPISLSSVGEEGGAGNARDRAELGPPADKQFSVP